MFSDLLATSVEQFAHDCMLLCAKHYPIIHSRGLQEAHLAKILCRRIQVNCQHAELPVILTPLENKPFISQVVYRLQHKHITVWVIAHHFISANKARRQALLNTIDWLHQHREAGGEHYLMIVSDHWFDRSKASKQLPAWWLGHLPEQAQAYTNAGIKLEPCDNSLAASLYQRFGYTQGQLALHHPFKRVDNQTAVLRYVSLTAIYRIH